MRDAHKIAAETSRGKLSGKSARHRYQPAPLDFMKMRTTLRGWCRCGQIPFSIHSKNTRRALSPRSLCIEPGRSFFFVAPPLFHACSPMRCCNDAAGPADAPDPLFLARPADAISNSATTPAFIWTASLCFFWQVRPKRERASFFPALRKWHRPPKLG